MNGIYAAIRSNFRQDQKLYKGRNPAWSVAYAFMNTLSLSALDEKQVDKFLIYTNTSYEEDESLIQNIMGQLKVEREKIVILHSQEYKMEQLIAFLKTLAKKTRTIMVGALSVVTEYEETDSVSLNLVEITDYFSQGHAYINTNTYQNELFPIDISQGNEQEEFLEGDFSKNPTLDVRHVNGVASILLKADLNFPNHHHFPLIQVEHFSFKKEEINDLVKFLEKLNINEKWIVEIDYLSIENLIDFRKKLEKNGIVLPETKSGGSIFYGNSDTLNGLRAISSAMVQIEEVPTAKAIALALTERNSIQLCLLNYNKEEK